MTFFPFEKEQLNSPHHKKNEQVSEIPEIEYGSKQQKAYIFHEVFVPDHFLLFWLPMPSHGCALRFLIGALRILNIEQGKWNAVLSVEGWFFNRGSENFKH